MCTLKIENKNNNKNSWDIFYVIIFLCQKAFIPMRQHFDKGFRFRFGLANAIDTLIQAQKIVL